MWEGTKENEYACRYLQILYNVACIVWHCVLIDCCVCIENEKYRTYAAENRTRKRTFGVAPGSTRVLHQAKATWSTAVGRFEIWRLTVGLRTTKRYAWVGPGPKSIGPAPGSQNELTRRNFGVNYNSNLAPGDPRSGARRKLFEILGSGWWRLAAGKFSPGGDGAAQLLFAA